MKIAHIAAEVAPWCKTGGLGDVLGALPHAQQAEGAEVCVFLPLHRQARETARKKGLELQPTGVTVAVSLAGHRVEGHFLRHTGPDGVRTFLLDCPRFFDRAGIYAGEDGAFGDNGLRFGFFCLAVLHGILRLMGRPDVLHAHDWHTAPVPMYLRHAPLPTVLTIHNLAYQGVFHRDLMSVLDLGSELFTPERLEYWGHINLLKGGLACADAVTAVSPSYAREVTTPEFGAGLHEFVRNHAQRLQGILNGIDTVEWDPASDPHLPARYSARDLSAKWQCRQHLLREFRLQASIGEPVLGVVSRFVGQKGLDLIAEIVPHLSTLGARLVALGTGEPAIEQRLAWLAERFTEHFSLKVDFNVPLAHRITAGADMFLMPSRFEPCGLNQMYAMAYGTVPVVHAVGGLRDTVDESVGYTFENPDSNGLLWALRQAIGRYRYDPDGWRGLMLAGMARDFSWKTSARRYLGLYRELGAGS